MAASIPAEDERYVLESQIRELYGRCAYTHKTHEKMAESAANYLWCVKWAQIVLSALTTGGAIGVVFDQNSTIYPLATAALSILMLIVNSYVKDIDPGQDAQIHRDAASDIWNVREAYLSLLTDIRDLAFSLEDIRKRRDDLQDKLHLIYKSAPHTNSKAYAQAQQALQKNEDLTFTDGEIDAFLPGPLKRSRVS
ncbi:SLATT domain-containing protein [Bradyrhizobium daqingense]|uniref:SLATT domain-containing protein n=1 Tax=Bradyrhizobium daqingense TaxID=993502 RepID=UPI003835E262